MKKMLMLLVVAVAVSCILSAPAAAQGAVAAIVKVPFSFIAGDRMLPAGKYRIEPQMPDRAVVQISRVDEQSGATVLVATYYNDVAEPDQRVASLKFVTYGGQHFLREVYIPGSSAREVPITRARAQQVLVKLNLMNAEPVDTAK